MQLHTIGIDLGKILFPLVGLNQRGEVVVRKKFSRKQLLQFTANLQVELIGMEACGRSHFLGRALREQGHEVRLMPAQYVKPYVKTNKSDYIDAEAMAEAVERPKMRFVPIKSDDQLDLQSLHRGTGALGDASHRSHQPDSWLTTGAWNHFAAGAMPCGCGLARDPGRCQRQARWRSALAAGTTEAGTRSLANADRRSRCGHSEDSWRERSLPTAGRDPWPRTCDGDRPHRCDRQRSSFQKGARVFRLARNRPGRIYHWGKPKLLGMSKRGNSYVRRLFVQGARAVQQQSTKQSSGLSAWLAQLTSRTHRNVAAVALANKLARMAWAVLGKQMTPG